MRRARRVFLAIIARCAGHAFPRPMAAPSEIRSQAYHAARVRMEANRLADDADRWDVERRRRRAAIVERILQGYSRHLGRKLTRDELRTERPILH